ncbi:hypothetical protein pb186bvf_003056 [Paramecium bursaria]
MHLYIFYSPLIGLLQSKIKVAQKLLEKAQIFQQFIKWLILLFFRVQLLSKINNIDKQFEIVSEQLISSQENCRQNLLKPINCNSIFSSYS